LARLSQLGFGSFAFGNIYRNTGHAYNPALLVVGWGFDRQKAALRTAALAGSELSMLDCLASFQDFTVGFVYLPGRVFVEHILGTLAPNIQRCETDSLEEALIRVRVVAMTVLGENQGTDGIENGK